MNVFSNSCAGGFVHAILSNEPYKHPFYWCIIDESEFVDWMLDFDNININDKIEVDYLKTKISKNPKAYWWTKPKTKEKYYTAPTLYINNRFYVTYPHYLNNMMEVFNKRIERYDKDDTNIFVLNIKNIYNTPEEVVTKFVSDDKYIKILITENEEHLKYQNDKLLVIYDNFLVSKNAAIKWYVYFYQDDIKEFVQKFF